MAKLKKIAVSNPRVDKSQRLKKSPVSERKKKYEGQERGYRIAKNQLRKSIERSRLGR